MRLLIFAVFAVVAVLAATIVAGAADVAEKSKPVIDLATGSDDSRAARHELHPVFKQFDLTRSGVKHRIVPMLNKIHEQVEDAKRMFLAARESEATAQIRKISQTIDSDIEPYFSGACDIVRVEASDADRHSALLRDQVKQLQEKMSAAAASPHDGGSPTGAGVLVTMLHGIAEELGKSEETFATMSTLQHVCATIGAQLEQLRLEVSMVIGSAGSDL
jgi:hypothetical protein